MSTENAETADSALGGGYTYSIIFQNNSSNAGSMVIFQSDPNAHPGTLPLAWFSKYTFPTTMVSFQWKLEYDFVWSQTGILSPGIISMASQVWPADLTTTNQVTLTNQQGAYTFKGQTQGPQPGSLYITQDNTIPPNMASVGIGMAGRPTFLVQAQPNMNVIFTPHPQYWIAFGNFNQGQVLNINEITAAAEIVFPGNIYSMTAILNADDTWTVKPTQSFNADIVEAKRLAAKG